VGDQYKGCDAHDKKIAKICLFSFFMPQNIFIFYTLCGHITYMIWPAGRYLAKRGTIKPLHILFDSVYKFC
jgi:hypothetical protein